MLLLPLPSVLLLGRPDSDRDRLQDAQHRFVRAGADDRARIGGAGESSVGMKSSPPDRTVLLRKEPPMSDETDLIPLRALNQVSYCDRLYYLEYVEAVMPT